MSKPIRITDDQKVTYLKEFEEALSKAKLSDGKISYTRTLTDSRKAKVWFTPVAWAKMTAVIHAIDKEIAWHGVCRRLENEGEYLIYDILVYPQEVSGATVNTDQKEYEMWLYQHDDEVFNNIRMQGHSHVNMSTSPSGVDTTHQEQILEQVGDDDYYIFMIWNKRFEKWVKVYDLASNAMYETSDVSVGIYSEDVDLAEYIKDALSRVKEKTYRSSQYGYYDNNGMYHYTGAYSGEKASAKEPEKKKEEPKALPPAERKKTQASSYDNGDSWDDGYPHYGSGYGFDYLD